MKKSKIIAPALGVLILSTAASISGTVAWFTANNSVQVTGMAFKTQVGNNLLIADNSSSAIAEASFGSSLTQNVKARLVPTSTIDGVGYYYTTIANDNGSAKNNSPFYLYSEGHTAADTDAKKDAYDEAFNASHVGGTIVSGYDGTGANVVYGYIDYTFYLKGTFITSGDKLIMDKCNLLYNNNALRAAGDGLDSDLSWRIAVLAHEATITESEGNKSVTPYTTAWAANTDSKTILAPTGAAYFTKTKGTSSDAPDAIAGVSGTTPTYGDVANYGSAALLYTASAANQTKAFKVTVRLWLEGEDTKCYVENYRTLTSEYTLSVSFKTESASVQSENSEAVKVIGSVAPVANP